MSRIEKVIDESNLAKHCDQPSSIVAAIGDKVVGLFEALDLISAAGGTCMTSVTCTS